MLQYLNSTGSRSSYRHQLTDDCSIREEELVKLTSKRAEEATEGRDEAADDGRHAGRLSPAYGHDER